MILRILFLLFLPASLSAQGFAGLGSDAEGFAVPQRETVLEFPRDHAAHPDHRIEWWYLTATLAGPDGTPYGVQWTLFRSALAPTETEGWNSPQLWMAHAALTTPDQHWVAERLARGGIGQAGVRIAPDFEAWIDEWALKGSPDLNALTLNAAAPEFSYDLALSATGPLVLQGDAGYSVKSAAGQASHYYSQPFYTVSGKLTLPSGTVAVTGQAWLDREWSSQPLAGDQQGWDWFSLVFDDGARLMGFVLRSDSSAPFTSATWIAADGTATPFPDGAFRAEPLARSTVEGRDIPTKWRAQLPERGVDVTVRALNPQSWMDTSVPYWEGPVDISGSHSGRGYLEMTGY